MTMTPHPSKPGLVGGQGATLAIALAATLAACGEPPPGRTYYERNIEPILLQSCSGNTAPCHRVDPGDPFGFAAGNLDVTSFENIQKRRDLLTTYGPYQVPPFLIKAVNSGGLQVAYGDEFIDLEIVHVGGANFSVQSDAYLTLLSWLENGATENGLPPPTPPQTGEGACSSTVSPGFDPAPYLAHPQFATFRDQVQPILDTGGSNCNAGNCHGAPQADFYITCGDDDTQLAFNFAQAWAFVADPPDQSQLLQVPLAVGAGGLYHSGGDHFASRDDADYETIRSWAEQVGELEFGEGDPGKAFFAAYVQPKLIQRGCSFQACHSPQAGNDLKLSAGSQGFYSAISLEKNYELLKREFMAFEFADARRGRAVAKGIFEEYGGIAHRGGAVLETPGGGRPEPASCAEPFDAATASAYCVVQEWVDIERAALLAADLVSPMGPGDTLPLVYVDRAATHVATPLEFDTYQPGSDLMVATATLGADGAITSVGGATSLLDGCAGAANRSQVDVRSPDIRFDGENVAFAMRTSAAEPLGVYIVGIDGSGCQRLTPAQPDANGLKQHDFDPAWSPDGEFVVFASTRGRPDNGPTRSRMLFEPQSDLWRMRVDGSGLEQMTFLTNSEISPQFKRKGQVTMTTEKVSEGFYQLAGRRLNWDLTDYHPLLAQRADSPYADPDDPSAVLPSIGYQQATDIREGANGNFLIILSDAGARGGAGTLGTFNRSVGPMEAGRDDPGYLPSLHIIDPAATGRVGSATAGAYRNPSNLPDDRILVSYTAYAGDLAAATSLDWDIVAIDPATGARQTLVGGAGAQVDAVLAIKQPPATPYYNRRQLVFGGSVNPDLDGDAVFHMPDAPMLFTLLTGNLRRGRPVEAFRGARRLAIWVEGFPPDGTTAGNQDDGRYESRTLLGTVDLRDDGSTKVRVPSGAGVVLELQDGDGNAIVTMGEEHQMGPNEQITMGIVEPLFDAVCGSCHGSVTGQELDVTVTPDALTGASQSLSAGESAVEP